MVRQTRKLAPKPAIIVAYDFETENIKVGTPRPLYLTAYANYQAPAKGPRIHYAEPIRDMAHLSQMIVNQFLTEELIGTKFVAWYGNGFDAYFIAAALINNPAYVLRPFLTRNNALRGLRVLKSADANKRTAKSWEFLDGMAMLGLAGFKLEKFLATFAPNHPKIANAIDFSTHSFDASNPDHCAYAMRDSEGLWHGMVNAQQILMDNFDEPLRVTMGGACIKIFQAHIPEETRVISPSEEVTDIVRSYVMRGGFCFCVRRFKGPVWKYDINQAYAAAMREAHLPAGNCRHLLGRAPEKVRAYIVRVTAEKSDNKIPFYCREFIDGRMRSIFAAHRINDSWITSIEYDQLRRERWTIIAHECYWFDDYFSMTDYVDKLENRRMTCEGGPSGAIGTMLKMVGNHSYGKTVERNDPMEFLMAANRPPDKFNDDGEQIGYYPFHADGDADPLPFVWFGYQESERAKVYHQPQLGAFITAHVRMVVRRAALISPATWLYADTDCVVFSSDVTDRLDIHPSRYGAWKIEEAGTVYELIAKKVYSEIDASKPDKKLKRSAKGLHVNKLSAQDFDEWFDGQAPVQHQVQRQNFLRVMQGADMFRGQMRSGTAIEVTR